MAYTVKSGDTLGKIAAANGMTLQEIKDLNPDLGPNWDLIHPGDTVNLSASDSSSSGSSGGSGVQQGTDTADFGEGASPTGEDDTRFYELPGRPEIWQNTDGTYYVVYLVPGAEPEIPMYWEASEKEVKAFFGDDPIRIDARVTDEQLENAGALRFGLASEIELRGGNPFNGWIEELEQNAEIMPWLEDPEVAAVFASSWLEGREPTEAELASTEWFRSKTTAEQQWLTTLYAKPEDAARIKEDTTRAVKNAMIAAGINNPPMRVVNYLAEQRYTGKKTEGWLNEQIAVLADPSFDGKLDSGVQAVIDNNGLTINTTAENEAWVRDQAITWLGSSFGQMSDADVQRWAGKIRNDPDAEDEFINYLRQQRLALFPEYENENLTFQDIAGPWRSFITNAWGQNVDDSDNLLNDVIRMNDAGEAGTLLRREGLKRGVKKVEDEFVGGMRAAINSNSGVKARF